MISCTGIRRFGNGVADIVLACTDSLRPEGKQGDWPERKQAYVAHLPERDEATLELSLTDKLYNTHANLRNYKDGFVVGFRLAHA